MLAHSRSWWPSQLNAELRIVSNYSTLDITDTQKSYKYTSFDRSIHINLMDEFDSSGMKHCNEIDSYVCSYVCVWVSCVRADDVTHQFCKMFNEHWWPIMYLMFTAIVAWTRVTFDFTSSSWSSAVCLKNLAVFAQDACTKITANVTMSIDIFLYSCWLQTLNVRLTMPPLANATTKFTSVWNMYICSHRTRRLYHFTLG